MDIDRTLRKIASNFWFEWNADVHLLFRRISPYIWSLFRRNLYRFLKIQAENPNLYYRRLAQLLTDSDFLALFQKVESDFNSYMQPKDTLLTKKFPEMVDKGVAYFSMEYGIDILRTYSGGLGILSGDHLRGASDYGVTMTGVGLLYLQGYYEQVVASDGQMKVSYDSLISPRKLLRDFLPLEGVKKVGTNEDLYVTVALDNRQVRARVWRARIGRVHLLLLDTNIPENKVHDRHITRRLYASQKQREEERRRRLEQEILLGVGGALALEGGGYKISAYHLNEGHVALAAVEIIRQTMNAQGLSFNEARERCFQMMGFTTHTPVAEGNERFDEGLVRHTLQPYLDSFLSHEEREVIFNCARNRDNMFDMTKLSLLLAGACRNGVSALHGAVCRKMWGYAWGNFDPEGREVPITHITNSVHAPYWQKPILRKLIHQHGGLDHISQIEERKIWQLHLEFKSKLIEKVRERYAYRLLREKKDAMTIHHETSDLLDIDAFFIGFARRFADYKRVTLFLEDEEKLLQFLENTYRKYGKPVHILYAGKPHPDNYSGRERIRAIYEISKRLRERAEARKFRSQIVFVEGYDIDLARYLTSGVDVWLNNPIRPLEASGTSGMKAGMNGVLNVSISDGWVPEGIEHGKNGWIFGEGTWEKTEQDRRGLFDLLEETILPLYYHREKGDLFSRRWVGMMKESIATLTQKFSTDRMIEEYVERMYLPAVRSHRIVIASLPATNLGGRALPAIRQAGKQSGS